VYHKVMLILTQDSSSLPVSHMLSNLCQDCLSWQHMEHVKDCVIYKYQIQCLLLTLLRC